MLASASSTIELNTPDGPVQLLPEGGVFEPGTDSLLVADVHLGKADSFRRLGVPVPAGPNQASLNKLDLMIQRYRPRQLVFLGDLVHDYLPGQHAVYNELAHWRWAHRNLAMTLVLGNHDRKAGPLPERCGIDTVQPGAMFGPVQLRHEPVLDSSAQASAQTSAQTSAHEAADNASYAVAGHIHPVVRIGTRNDTVRVRCFWAQSNQLVLPAFGAFTGGYRISASAQDTVFIPTDTTVHRLPASAHRQQRR